MHTTALTITQVDGEPEVGQHRERGPYTSWSIEVEFKATPERDPVPSIAIEDIRVVEIWNQILWFDNQGSISIAYAGDDYERKVMGWIQAAIDDGRIAERVREACAEAYQRELYLVG